MSNSEEEGDEKAEHKRLFLRIAENQKAKCFSEQFANLFLVPAVLFFPKKSILIQVFSIS